MDEAFKETAQWMKWQLEDTRLTVELAPSPTHDNGRMLRVATTQNPNWYKRFCSDHSPSGRKKRRQRKKPDTYIKRNHTLRALGELASGRCESVYAERVRPYVEREHKKLMRLIEKEQLFI